MIGLGLVYLVAGLMFAALALLSALDGGNPKRWRNTLFWGLFAVSFLAGDFLGGLGNGLLVIAMALIAGVGGLGHGRPATTGPAQREASARRWGNWLFLPALLIPAVTLLGTLFLKNLQFDAHPLVDARQVTWISLTLGVLAALALALPMLRPPPLAPFQEARRLMDSVGWAALLPQTLAALGAVFALAGVGHVVGDLIGRVIPVDNRFAVVAAYTCGMALFTAIMGNAFAAFPVMTAGVGLPLIVRKFGGDPAVLGAVGMLSGFCGTLMTPMAANFNIVPAALLELPDRNGVIKAQVPTAILLLIANTLLMYFLVFRGR